MVNISEIEFYLKIKGNLIEGECEALVFIEKQKKTKILTKLILKENNVSEGILIEEGVVYYVQFKYEKEIKNSRKIKYGGARIMLIGSQAVGKVKSIFLKHNIKILNLIFKF